MLARRVRVVGVLLGASLLLAACSSAVGVRTISGPGWVSGPPATRPPYSGPGRASPNIVFVLTDDLTWNLLKYMPHVLAMQDNGLTFSHYFVSDSLCCPSRASIFTGQFPHNTGVWGNLPPTGGFGAYVAHGDQLRSFATILRAQGYLTGFFGKFMNAYNPNQTTLGQVPYVPPGWSAWNVAGKGGYEGYNYRLAVGRQAVTYGSKPIDYLTSVMSTKTSKFIADSAQANWPFFAEISTFAPHSPSVPSPQDVNKFTNLPLPQSPSFGKPVQNAVPWETEIPPLNNNARARLTKNFRLRVQSVQAVDRAIGRLQAELHSLGEAANTYFVFSSDNGLHLGDHNFRQGKQTAFDTDVNVPLIITGPGIAHGTTNPKLVQNVDLAPTFERLAGGTPPPTVDGHSLDGLLHGIPQSDWRTAVLIEHHGPITSRADPDFQGKKSGGPPPYAAIRTSRYLYVRYQDGNHEFFDLTSDPYQLNNVYAQLSPHLKSLLSQRLARMTSCHGPASCWAAQHPR